ncbi:MAG: LacI family DNA-binding transcriptional regulator [Verrucomicrobiota bacterium]
MTEAQQSEKEKNIRMIDIARLANLSVATVSVALRGEEGVKPETRHKVLRLARQYNYRPNLQAQSLRLQKTRRVAMILPELENLFLIEKLRLAREIFWTEGYEVSFSCTNWDPDTEKEVTEYFLAQQVDALIISQVSGREVDHLEEFCAKGKPVCVIGPLPRSFQNMISIQTDLCGGMAQAVRLLLGFGHRYFGTVGINPNLIARREGIAMALREAGLQEQESVLHIPCSGPHLHQGREAMSLFIRQQGSAALPSAVLAVNDDVAIGIIAALEEHGLEVPRDVSVVGCDNIKFAAYVKPPLTTVSQSAGKLGRLAAKLVLEQLQSGKRGSRYIQEPTELVVRQSTGPPKSGGKRIEEIPLKGLTESNCNYQKEDVPMKENN